MSGGKSFEAAKLAAKLADKKKQLEDLKLKATLQRLSEAKQNG